MQKIKLKSHPVILKNSDFQSIQISVLFFFEENISDMVNIQLLPSMLRKMNNTYSSEEDFQLNKKKLYILGINCSSSIIGTTNYISFDISIPNINILNEDLLEKQFKFFQDYIYNPKINDNAFDNDLLQREIKNLQLSIKNALNNIGFYQNKKLLDYVDDQGILSRSLIDHQEEIGKVTGESLYQFYLKNIKNNQPVIYIMGDVDSLKFNKLCDKYLYRKKFVDKIYHANFNHFLKVREMVTLKCEDSNFKDSIYSMVFKVKDINENDIILLNAIKDILSSPSSRLLDKVLRDDNDLIYSSLVKVYKFFGLLEITVFINKNNILMVKEKLNEVMELLKNEELITECLEKIKERKRLALIRQLDDKYFLFDDFIESDLGIDVSFYKYLENYKKITWVDLNNFIKRLKLDTTYFLKEGKN